MDRGGGGGGSGKDQVSGRGVPGRDQSITLLLPPRPCYSPEVVAVQVHGVIAFTVPPSPIHP